MKNDVVGDERMTVLSILSEMLSDVDVENCTTLVDDGYLESLDMITLIAEINHVFGVVIPPEDLIPENFNSYRALTDLVSRLEE